MSIIDDNFCCTCSCMYNCSSILELRSPGELPGQVKTTRSVSYQIPMWNQGRGGVQRRLCQLVSKSRLLLPVIFFVNVLGQQNGWSLQSVDDTEVHIGLFCSEFLWNMVVACTRSSHCVLNLPIKTWPRPCKDHLFSDWSFISDKGHHPGWKPQQQHIIWLEVQSRNSWSRITAVLLSGGSWWVTKTWHESLIKLVKVSSVELMTNFFIFSAENFSLRIFFILPKNYSFQLLESKLHFPNPNSKTEHKCI